MSLRELKKGEKVLVIGKTSNFNIGDIVTIKGRTISGIGYKCSNGEEELGKSRGQLLAIGDKVTRGPDWERCYYDQDGGEGNAGVITHILPDRPKQPVRVLWDNGSTPGANPYYRMTPNHQDLKPTGDSVEDGKPECFGNWVCNGHSCQTCPNIPFSQDTRCGCDLERCLHARGCKAQHDGEPEKEDQFIKESDKPECFGKYPCRKYPACSGCPSQGRSQAGNCKCNACKHQHHGCNPELELNEPKPLKEEKTTMPSTQETFDRLERANQIKLVEKPKAENKIKAAEEDFNLLEDEMNRLLKYPTLFSEKQGMLEAVVGKEKAKETMRLLDLGMPVSINITKS